MAAATPRLEARRGGAMATTTEGARVEELEHTLEDGLAGTRRIKLPDRPIELHEMPGLTAEAVGAPEAEYIAPRRPWLRFLGVGLAAGAVGLAAGIGLGLTVLAPTEPLADYATSLRMEHLAQAPLTGGFAATRSLAMEHLAQTPGGFPVVLSDYATSLAMEHVAQTPGGFPVVLSDYATSLAMEHVAQTPGGFPG
jgi:hypothetical protein